MALYLFFKMLWNYPLNQNLKVIQCSMFLLPVLLIVQKFLCENLQKPSNRCVGVFFFFFWELPRTASHAERLYVMSYRLLASLSEKNLLPINQVRNINTTWAQLRGAMRGTPRQSPGRPIGGHYLAGRAWPLLVCGLHRPCKLRTQVFPFSPSLTPHLDPSPAITFSVPCCCRCGMLWSQEK